jgi:hypothetical protein
MDDEDDDSLGPNTASDVFPAQYLFGATQHNGHLSQAHPPAPHVMIYWNLYIENCECLLRLLHVPSVAKIMAQTQMDPTALTRGQEALVSAIYYAAVTSTPAEEVLGHFGVDRHSLIARYEAAVQQALVNASFLNTQDLTVLQAFVLYLVCTRHNDGASVWSMTGLAIRIAQGMGIDRDGELFKLSPLEVELRRRVWHQISLLDLRSSEARGAKPMHLVYDTKTPLNINDADIGPETLVMPAARVGYTDATVALLRLEVCDMTRKLYRTQGVAGKQKLIEDFEQHMELDYLRYCGAGPPLQRMCMNLGRLVVKRMILMIVKREADLPMPVREKLFNIAVDIVDLSNQLRRDEYARRWSWLVKTYVSLLHLSRTRQLLTQTSDAMARNGLHPQRTFRAAHLLPHRPRLESNRRNGPRLRLESPRRQSQPHPVPIRQEAALQSRRAPRLTTHAPETGGQGQATRNWFVAE